MPTPKEIVDEFCTICRSVRNSYDLYRTLFETDQQTLDLYASVAPLCFGDLNRVLIEHLFLQFSKITDPARTGKKFNLTTNYVVEELPWPVGIRQRLSAANDRLMAFRKYIEPARSKRIAHVDLASQVELLLNLGEFPKGAEKEFLIELQTFVDIAYGHLNNGSACPIVVSMSTDTHQLVRALEQSAAFERCTKCDAGERAVTVLDMRPLAS